MTLLYLAAAALLIFSIAVYAYTVITDPKEPDPLTDEAVAEVARSGNTRLAIKWYRTIHGGSLTRAKKAVLQMAREPRGDHGG